MSGRSRKRKQREQSSRPYYQAASWETEKTEPDPALFIQAHEADIVRGPQAWASASSLEVKNVKDNEGKSTGLIQWRVWPTLDTEGDEEQNGNETVIWVDRYDARLLLDALPHTSVSYETTLLALDGWSDLPSDAEDTFFFTREEAEDYHREKRRRTIDQGREERLRALEDAETEEDGNHEEDVWGGSDEEPDEAQKELMRRTAAHLVSSPNPAQLEMRILANHGADRRFAFLRGRWSRAWKLAKGHARLDVERERLEKENARPQAAVLGGLSGYGDSDSDDESSSENAPGGTENENANARNDTSTTVGKPPDEPAAGPSSEEAAKAARRARAREWAAKRRAGTAGVETAS